MDEHLSNKETEELRVSLREYLEVRLKALEDKVNKSETVLGIRLDSMNEFRGALSDQLRTFMPRTEYMARHEKLEQDIQLLREFKATIDSKASQSSLLIAYAISLISLIVGIWGLIEKIKP